MHQTCYSTIAPGLKIKGISRVIDCHVKDTRLSSIQEIRTFLENHAKNIIGREPRLEYDSSEPIGYTHSIYRFHLPLDEGRYIGVRLVLKGQDAIRVLYTVPDGLDVSIQVEPLEYQPLLVNPSLDKDSSRVEPPRGQYYVESPIVYAILGVPRVNVSTWMLEVKGEVENELALSLADLYELGVDEIKTSFHCVTGWSLREVSFTGVLFKKIIEIARPRSNVKWVYVESLDGYSTIIPYSELSESTNSMIALEMNGRPLDILHGYPARLVIPHLYGWKSAKWIKQIYFTSEYRDGYWEALGYHPRGRVDLEERFKES